MKKTMLLFVLLCAVVSSTAQSRFRREESSYEGKFYELLDYIATHPKTECQDAELSLVQILSRSDFDINRRYSDFLPPLAYLIRKNKEFLGKFRTDYISDNVLKILIDKGANVNTYDNDGNSLIAFAVETENDYLTSYFISKGIDLKKKNSSGKDALYLAIESGNTPLIKQMQNNGIKLNINTLKNEPSSFKNHTETYNYIAEVCGEKALNYEDIVLFRNKFGDKFDLVKAKYDNLAKTDAQNAVSYEDINAFNRKFPDRFEMIKAKHDNLYYTEAKQIDDAYDYITSLIKSNKLTDISQTGNYVNICQSFLSRWKIHDPNNKLPLAQNIIDCNTVMSIYNGKEMHGWGIVKYTYLTESKNIFGTDNGRHEWVTMDGGAQRGFAQTPLRVNYVSNLFNDVIQVVKRLVERKAFGDYGLSYFTLAKDVIIANHGKFKAVVADNQDFLKREDERNLAVARTQRESWEQKIKAEKQIICDQCIVDRKKTTIPRTEKDFLGITSTNPGKIYMQNGSIYNWYWGGKKGLKVVGFIWDDYYKTWEEMEQRFIRECKEKNCDF
jgi:hypothetical protein